MTLLYDELTTSPLFCSLYGTKRIFEKHLKLANIYYIFNQNKKASLILNSRKDPTKPWGYFALNSIQIQRDQGNNKVLRKVGQSHVSNKFNNAGNATNATVYNYYMFPTLINCEFHYFNEDIKVTTKFIDVFLILAVTDCFNFMLKVNDSAKWNVRVEVQDDTINISDMALESPEAPQEHEITMPFIIHTRTGFIRDVAKVNSDHPTITFGFSTNEELTESIP